MEELLFLTVKAYNLFILNNLVDYGQLEFFKKPFFFN